MIFSRRDVSEWKFHFLVTPRNEKFDSAPAATIGGLVDVSASSLVLPALKLSTVWQAAIFCSSALLAN